jgi:methylmalonyl-CoA mutase N-terminal domain/subunit
MQLLIEEMGLCDTVDPLAGSYYVETLTNQMREEMEKVMAEVEADGGIVKLVSEGVIQSRVSAQAYETQQKIQSGEMRKVGVNCHRIEEEDKEVAFHPYSEVDAEQQIRRLRRLRDERDGDRVEQMLDRVVSDAQSGVNVMPAIMDAVQAYATIGEITRKLIGVYGHYEEPIRF